MRMGSEQNSTYQTTLDRAVSDILLIHRYGSSPEHPLS